MKRHVFIFGLVGGVLIALLQYTQYRFLVLQHSLEIYGALVAALFSAFGIWLGMRLTRRRDGLREYTVAGETPAPQPTFITPAFSADTAQQEHLRITSRELEILGLVAKGMSNREIAGELFVSESTVKTHCARAFDKLGVARRTQAVQRGRELGLLP